ncbi:MAG: NAD(P)H-hydrate dehydratase [Burkholderiales bacterium]|nr:NAD(P)H-hydrate dehydratase [Burkholderiales bacterium]
MKGLLGLSQLRDIESKCKERQIDLIERGGLAAFDWIRSNFNNKTKILVLAGRGSNGAYGLATAFHLMSNGYKVDFVRLAYDNSVVNDEWFNKASEHKKAFTRLPKDISRYGLVVDAIYGIGLMNELDVDSAKSVQRINNDAAYILSLDAPSGVNPFSGRVFGNAINADTTLTFISDKVGFHTSDGLDYSGEVLVADLINLSEFDLLDSQQKIEFNSLETINYQSLLRGKSNTNKGTYGSVAIIGGNKGMHGALYLAGKAALMSGSGKVVLAPLDKDFCFDFSMPELMISSPKDVIKDLQSYEAIAIGCGLGRDEKAVKILSMLLDVIEDSKLIVDADALNLIAENIILRNKFLEVRHKIITPHPGEAARIIGLTVNAVQENRFTAIADISDLLHGVVVLKGAGTLISSDNNIYINVTGNSGLANAGQGDTLTGIILGLLSQGLDIITATRFGVYLHGLAGDRLLIKNKGYNGILASKVSEEVCITINDLLYGDLFKSE